MAQLNVTKDLLRAESTIDNPIVPFSWDYYSYVKEHPIVTWKPTTAILRGEGDELCEFRAVSGFAVAEKQAVI